MDEASWMNAQLALGALTGNIFFGYITNSFGRKVPLMIMAVPMIVSSISYSAINNFRLKINS